MYGFGRFPMRRIFIAVRHARDPREYFGSLWSDSFCRALRAMGCEVVESQVDLLPCSRFMHIGSGFTPEELDCRARISERILDEVRSAHTHRPLDLFISYFYNAHFDPAGFCEVRRLGIPSVNFYCNSIYQFELVCDVARAADFSWHPEKLARPLYVAAGARPLWVQMAADPSVYQPVAGIQRRATACFIGQRYADRDRWVASLVRAGVPLEVYGAGWGVEDEGGRTSAALDPSAHATGGYLGRERLVPGSRAAYLEAVRENFRRQGWVRGGFRTARQWLHRRASRSLLPVIQTVVSGSISFQHYQNVMTASAIVLNFSNVWADGRAGSPLIPHVRLRDFEAPMCRACYITGFTEEITEFYEIGREIDTYRSPEELIDKCRFYLTHPDEAEQLRNGGYLRARRDHTWERRFEQLFRLVASSSPT